jgi:hypothetical protein
MGKPYQTLTAIAFYVTLEYTTRKAKNETGRVGIESNGTYKVLAYTDNVFYSHKKRVGGNDYIRDKLSAGMRQLYLEYFLSICYLKTLKRKYITLKFCQPFCMGVKLGFSREGKKLI